MTRSGPTGDVPDVFDEVHASTERFLASVRALSDGEVRGPTRIPPWTRGHVVTHVARAADSYCRLLAGAVDPVPGVETPQYPSSAFRADQIADGAGRPVTALVDDVVAASAAFEQAMRTLPAHARTAQVRMRPGELRFPAELPRIRLRELEVHHVDLDVGYDFADIPPATATWILDDVLAELTRRDPVPAVRLEATDVGLVRELGADATCVRGSRADLVAWLSGRSPGTGLAVDPSGAVPGAPIWI